MVKTFNFIFIIINLLSLFATGSMTYASQPYSPPPSPSPIGEMWRWHHVAELDNAGFNCMASAPDGSIWFGVNNGALRYDGNTWESYDATSGLKGAVSDITVSKDGTIYAISLNRLFYFDGTQWIRILPLNDKDRILISNLIPSESGGIWVGISGALFYTHEGHSKLYSAKRRIKRIQPVIPKQTVLYITPDVRKADKGGVAGIFEAHDGTLTIAYSSGWFLRFNPKSTLNTISSIKIDKNIEHGQAVSMMEMDDGKLWAGFGSNVYLIDFATHKLDKWPLSERQQSSVGNHALIRTRNGLSYIASLSRIFCKSFAGNSWEEFAYPRLDVSTFPQMMIDQKDNLWVGKQHASVYRIDLSKKRWETYDGLIFQDEDNTGTKWFLDADGNVISQHADTWVKYDQNDGLIDTAVSLLCSKTGHVWVFGSHKKKAATAFLDHHKVWNKRIHYEFPLLVSHTSPYEDKNGCIWFGSFRTIRTSHEGIICASPEGDNNYNFEYKYLRNGAWHITELSDGTFVTANYRIRKMVGSEFAEIEAKPEKYLDIGSTEEGSLWTVERGLGVQRLKDQQWTRYTKEDGLADNMVSALLCRNSNSIWALSASGLNYFDGTSWTPNIYGPLFPGSILLSGTIKESKDGSIWLNYVNEPWYIRTIPMYSKKISNITFKSIRCRPLSAPPETKITFSTDRVALPGNTTIRWKGFSLWQETENVNLYYSWRLNDESWSAFSPELDTTLLALKPGKHTFEVRARDYDLNIDSTPASTSFVVIAPVWQNAWFVILMLFLLSMIILSIWLMVRVHEIQAVAEEKLKTNIELMKLGFFTNVSHELRTPLTVLLGTLKSMLSSPEAISKDRLSIAFRNARRLHTLVNQILDLRKLEDGEWKLQPSYGDIVLFVREIVESLKPMANEKRMSIHWMDAGAKSVSFDPDKLQKIVTNLLSNAIKYGREGGNVSISLDIEYRTDDKCSKSARAIIIVEDDGIGIKEEELSHIFEQFYRGSGYEPIKAIGSGIGLAFAQEIVKLWKGEISAESPVKEGHGTRFTVVLPLDINADNAEQIEAPLKLQDPPAPTESTSLNDEDLIQREKEKLLIIDDDDDLREFIRQELSKYYEIHEASDGEIGLQSAKEIIPDLIVSDVAMPKMNGIELCTKLKEDQLTQTIPLILLSGHSAEENKLQGLHAGADDYLAKPFEITKLHARIKNLLKTHQLLRNRYSEEIAKAPTEPSNPIEIKDSFLLSAIEIVENNLNDFEFDAGELAQKMFVSSTSLWRKLKISAKKSPAIFIRELRLKQAYQLLQQECFLIEDVTARVGFLDSNYFRRCFKKQFGITPKQCRDGIEAILILPDKNDSNEEIDKKQPPKILIVEDDHDLRSYLRDELRALHYDLLEADNGQKGLTIAKESLPDMILTDLMMPIMGGMELCKELKQCELTNHIPIIMLTARTAQEIELEGYDAGADEYLTKPFELSVLAIMINNLLENRKRMAAHYRQQVSKSIDEMNRSIINDPFLRHALETIEEHLADPQFNVMAFAEKMGVSDRTLRTKTSALLEQTPSYLIKEIRLKKAHQLLNTTDNSISEIAYACGFDDPNHFSRTFKKHFGKNAQQVRSET